MWVGRNTCPNWVSAADRSAWTSSRKPSLSSFCVSCQSTGAGDLHRRRARPRGRAAARSWSRRTSARTTTAASSGLLSSLIVVDVVELADRAPVVLVDVPGVPLVRDVAVQLEQVAARRRARSPRGPLAASTSEVIRPAVVDHDPQQAVVQHEPAARLASPTTSSAPATSGAGAQGRHAVPGVRRGVERDGRGRPRRPGRASASAISSLGPLGDRGVVALGVPVHPGDRAAGQDVVELLQQHQSATAAPAPSYGIVAAGPDGGRGRPQLGLAQQVLAAPVALLGPGLAWCSVPRCSSRYISPRQTGASGYSASARGEEGRRRARSAPSASPPASRAGARRRSSPGSARRRRRRTRTASATVVPRPFSAYCRSAWASSAPDSSEL